MNERSSHRTQVVPRLWTPPQFSMRAILVAVLLISVFCAVLRIRGLTTFFSTLICFLLAWLVVLLYRLFGLSDVPRYSQYAIPPSAHGPAEVTNDEFMGRLMSLARTSEYPVDAYLFVVDALALARERIHADVTDPAFAHVDAVALCRHAHELAISEYGDKAVARAGLASMNIHECSDIGNIVFHLVDAGLLHAAEGDNIQAFSHVFDFDEEFGISDE